MCTVQQHPLSRDKAQSYNPSNPVGNLVAVSHLSTKCGGGSILGWLRILLPSTVLDPYTPFTRNALTSTVNIVPLLMACWEKEKEKKGKRNVKQIVQKRKIYRKTKERVYINRSDWRTNRNKTKKEGTKKQNNKETNKKGKIKEKYRNKGRKRVKKYRPFPAV